MRTSSFLAVPDGGFSVKLPLSESNVTQLGNADPSAIDAESWKPPVCVACSKVSSGRFTCEVCEVPSITSGNSRTAMNPCPGSAAVELPSAVPAAPGAPGAPGAPDDPDALSVAGTARTAPGPDSV